MSPPADTHPSRGTSWIFQEPSVSLYICAARVIFIVFGERSLSSTRLSLVSAPPRWRFRVGKDFWLAVDCVLHLYPSLLLLLLLRLGWLVLSAPLHVDDDEEDQLFLERGLGKHNF